MNYKKLLVMLFICFTLSSCGIKGDLYLPEQEKENSK